MLMNNHHDHDEPDEDSHLVVDGNLFKDEGEHPLAGSQQQVVLHQHLMMTMLMLMLMLMTTTTTTMTMKMTIWRP